MTLRKVFGLSVILSDELALTGVVGAVFPFVVDWVVLGSVFVGFLISETDAGKLTVVTAEGVVFWVKGGGTGDVGGLINITSSSVDTEGF